MRKFILYILILFTLIGIFGPTVKVNAQLTGSCTLEGVPVGFDEAKCKAQGGEWTVSATTYGLLSPLPDLTSFDSAEPDALGKYLNTMITIIIGIAAVLAVVMIVRGGIEYMTSELVHSKEAGKEKITGAVLGLLIALGAYALLYTINPDLLNTDLSSVKDVTVTVDLEADVPQTYDPVTKKYPKGALFGAKWDDSVGLIATLPEGVTAKPPQCTTIGQPGCTSTRKLNTGTVGAIRLACKCELLITGGTESWLHGGKSGNTSHQLGGSTVDLRRTPELDKYLSGGKPLVPMKRYPAAGGPYLYEGDHWHIGR